MSEKSSSKIIVLAGLIKESGEKIASGVADVAKSVANVSKGVRKSGYSIPAGTSKKQQRVVGKGKHKSKPKGSPGRKP